MTTLGQTRRGRVALLAAIIARRLDDVASVLAGSGANRCAGSGGAVWSTTAGVSRFIAVAGQLRFGQVVGEATSRLALAVLRPGRASVPNVGAPLVARRFAQGSLDAAGEGGQDSDGGIG